ncbi:acetyl-CoA carboxylase biotin carboxylase subunit [Sphingopyxis sp.]|uniref:acetyl-CoA carboxylase biotin carboxylase subunit n=1 Tax=Sphingopyxis sp. TaxID=1908224 RepID=UPI003D0C7E30
MVANRGEIAVRILRTVQARGLRGLLVAHRIDSGSPAVAMADAVAWIDGPTPVAAYLNGAQIIASAKELGAEAIHPGYGFLSENSDFAAAVEAAGIVWIGPEADTITLMGDKVRARRFVEDRGFPVAPSAIEDDDPGSFAERARAVGAPLLLKPSAGGGGKGMRIVRDLALLDAEIERARSEGQRYFGDGRLFAERYVENPRHIEVQVLGDGQGGVVHLFERECSLQRRFQKVIEEAPSATLDADERSAICDVAAGIAHAVDYRGAGTVEFIYSNGDFYFLEMNTRLQVEHPVTEMVTGIDLVAAQLDIAAGQRLPWAQDDIKLSGHAVEARLYAEDPARDFAPTNGSLLRFDVPNGAGVRLDSGVSEGADIGVAFDPMLAKLIAHGATRDEAIARLRAALDGTTLFGLRTNLAYLERLLGHPEVAAGRLHTGLIGELGELLADPPIDPADQDALHALAAFLLPDVERQLARVAPLHAAIGEWRN